MDAGTGTVTAQDDHLRVNDAGECLIALWMDTDFDCPDWPTCRESLWSRPGPALGDWPGLLTRHAEDFSGLYDRQTLSLPDDPPAQRLYALGRYLLISAARQDSPMPMSLQGVWNDDVACRIGWTCDLHLDINTQMNYWPAGPMGLSAECRPPLFRWMEERLLPHGRVNAARHYGMRGWAGELVANAWGYARPYWNKSLAPCPACGMWEALDYAEHWRYTGDRVFLTERALPVLEEAADFILDYVFDPGDGALATGPSVSPENAFMAADGKHYASVSPAFEVSMVRAVLSDLL